jgi:hypothetical protein
MVQLNGWGWLIKVYQSTVYSGIKLSRGGGGGEQKRANQGRKLSIQSVTKNLPDCSIGVMNLGLDHIPKRIDIFLDVKYRQGHDASEP